MARAVVVALWLFRVGITCASAQEPTLTTDSEESFRRFIFMAQSGKLGGDVSNANVALSGAQARVELVRRTGVAKVFVLTPKRSVQTINRYFDITADENATAEDVVLVGRMLDECFSEDPFQFAGLEESLSGAPIPTMGEAWGYGGWRGVLRVLERRLMAPASLAYTVTVSVGLALGFAVSLMLLWSTNPRRPT